MSKLTSEVGQLVHADMKFDPNASPQCYRSNDEVIAKDTKVRMQIVGCRIEANDIVGLPSRLPSTR